MGLLAALARFNEARCVVRCTDAADATSCQPFAGACDAGKGLLAKAALRAAAESAAAAAAAAAAAGTEVDDAVAEFAQQQPSPMPWAVSGVAILIAIAALLLDTASAARPPICDKACSRNLGILFGSALIVCTATVY